MAAVLARYARRPVGGPYSPARGGGASALLLRLLLCCAVALACLALDRGEPTGPPTAAPPLTRPNGTAPTAVGLDGLHAPVLNLTLTDLPYPLPKRPASGSWGPPSAGSRLPLAQPSAAQGGRSGAPAAPVTAGAPPATAPAPELQAPDLKALDPEVGGGVGVRVMGPASLPCLHTVAPGELGARYDEYDALHRTLVHKPLRDVNSSHVSWWFAQGVSMSSVQYGGRWYRPAYKLWHPVDHVSFTRVQLPDPRPPPPPQQSAPATSTPATPTPATPPSPAPAALLPGVHIVEQFRGPRNATAGGALPAGSRAVQQSAEAVVVSAAVAAPPLGGVEVVPVDVTLVSRDTAPNMHRLLYYVGPTVMQELVHTWEDTPRGLVITSRRGGCTFILGGRNPAAAAFNAAARDSVFPPERLQAWTLHCVEEFGNFERFLPDVFRRHAGAEAAGTGGLSGTDGGREAASGGAGMAASPGAQGGFQQVEEGAGAGSVSIRLRPLPLPG
ncbi:hypothetical protein HYH03_015590 [Edaphochlamys debaryana]|uniref:DAPG hydrolase PhiG domain-containing protein n=1 Tax=Edaphochlamys debaryana TaxID=47281 RepID=A0A835XRM2_9CHLO|nr:hypothetical protein HYH03_015590 [Edaphochlamys debaryana]|eukprot:KAG2485705.1 hypothetical protein HYH03_015590 [Edaphochlamys debaryana]